MTITEPAEHIVGGLGAKSEHRPAWCERGLPLREGEPDGSRSSVSQPIGGDDNPLRREAKRPGQERVHSAIGLVGQDIVGWPGSRALRRRCAVQKLLKARAVDRSKIVSELRKSATAAWGIRSAVCHREARRAPATHLAVIDMRKARACAVVVGCEDYRGPRHHPFAPY
jgi:hypothetical protein